MPALSDGYGGEFRLVVRPLKKSDTGAAPFGQGWNPIPGDEHGGMFKLSPSSMHGEMVYRWPSFESAVLASTLWARRAREEAEREHLETLERVSYPDGDEGPRMSRRWTVSQLRDAAHRCAEILSPLVMAKAVAGGLQPEGSTVDPAALGMPEVVTGSLDTNDAGQVLAGQFNLAGFTGSFNGRHRVPVLSLEAAGLPMPYHVAVPAGGWEAALRKGMEAIRSFLQGVTPERGIFRRVGKMPTS